MYISPSGHTILDLALSFIYEIEVRRIYPDRVELVSSQKISKAQPLKEKYVTKYNKTKDYVEIVTVEWIGAPLKFIVDNNFELLDCDTYINNIKEQRKNKK